MSSLKSSEWILVCSLLVVLASLVLIAKVSAHRASSSIVENQIIPADPIAVEITGAVSKPGIYQLPPGTKLSLAIRKAKPKPFADLSMISLDQRIETPLSFEIEELKEIYVTVKGAVEEPLYLRLPIKSRMCDLKSKIQFLPDADLSLFKSRRILKNGENIEVAKKSVE